MKKVLVSILMLSAVTTYSQNCSCILGYPDNSNLPKSGVTFNENEVLRAIEPNATNCIIGPTYIKVWYNDEHALLLGVRRVVVIKSSGTTTTDYPISTYSGTPSSVTNPLVGTLTGNDPSNRPIWPALFITDITSNPSNRNGDWQQGGVGRKPDIICGSWKGAVKTVDSTKSPVTLDISPDADPSKNNWDLAGCDAPPVGTTNQGYGTLLKWSVSSLGLLAGHTYRIQVIVHDGDQNKVGGDAGEMCTTVTMPVVLAIKSLKVLSAKNVGNNTVINFSGESTNNNETVTLNVTLFNGEVKYYSFLLWDKLKPTDTWEVTINNLTNQVLTIKKK